MALPLHIRRCRTARNVIMNANRAAGRRDGLAVRGHGDGDDGRRCPAHRPPWRAFYAN